MNTRKKSTPDREEVSALENTLSGALTPVRPPDETLQRLREKIGSLESYRISKRLSNWELSIITAGSVLAVATVILTVTRALFYFYRRAHRN
jgi:hypothetical protein